MCVCVCVCVCVCGVVNACSLRAVVALDLCPFGGRKFACAGGVGDVGVRGCREEVGREEGRVGGERTKEKVRNVGRTYCGCPQETI